jgi:ABC-type multidrug transport system fused ATPase/permease subunit
VDVYLRLLGYLKPHRAAIAFTWLMSIGVLALQAVTLWIGAGFIERVLRGGEAPRGMLAGVGDIALALNRVADAVLTRATPFRSLSVALAILVGTGVLTMVLRVWKMAIFARINQSVLRAVRVDVFNHLTRLDLTFSKRILPGEVSSLMVRDVDALRDAIIDLCDRIFMQPLRLVTTVAMLVSLSPSLTLVFAVALIVCGGAAHLVGQRVHRLLRRSMERVARLQGFLTEYLTTVLLARSLGRETLERKRFDDLCGQMAEADRELAVTDSLAPQLVNNLFMVAGAVIVLVGGYRVLVTGTMDSGALLRFILCLPLATYPVESLALLYVSSRRATASASRVFAIFDEPPAAADTANAVEPPDRFTLIRFANVAFRPGGRSVFEDLTFDIRAGQRILVGGPSGIGKTTVLHLVSGVIRPDAGHVTLDGVDLAAFRGESWRRKIGIVPQESIMMNGTVRENLRFASAAASEERMVAMLMQVRFEADEASCRLALDRPVGNRGELLAGGERQRLAIARALLTDPVLLLMDEPVSHLDAVNRLRVKQTIAELPREVTVLFTSHDGMLHDLADQVIQLGASR